MDYRYKQLEQELSALSKVFSDLGVRLSEVAKEVTSPGVMPSEKLLEQISASRTSFENCRTAIHGHAGSMLVSPLPKMGELVSITAIDSLLKASAVAEESKFSIETERAKALEILGRVLAITHRETTEFKPLQECHAKLGEIRSAISNVLWPHKHPESESIVAGKHPSNALLSFVENLDSLDDEKWMALETTITESYGKPLFVAASRGKLAVGVEAKADTQPAASKPPVVVATPAPPKAPVVAPPEPPKPVAAAEKPVEKKIVVEKAPEKPAATPAPPTPAVAPAAIVEKKVAAPPAPVVPAAAAPVAAVAVERKEVVQDRTPQKPAAPPAVTPTAAPAPVTAAPPAPAVSVEKKEASEKPQPITAPSTPAVSATPAATHAPAAPAPAAPTPIAPQIAASVVSAATPVASATPSPAAAPAHPAPGAPVASVPAAASAVAPPRPPAPAPVSAQTAPAPVAATPAPVPSAPPVASNSHATPPAQPQHVAGNSLSALANATELSADKRPGSPVPVDAIDRQRKEPRLAAPAPQPVVKTEPNSEEFSADEAEKAAAGDSSQRPQRWGFWRGNRT
jgi:hypothetical protein